MVVRPRESGLRADQASIRDRLRSQSTPFSFPALFAGGEHKDNVAVGNEALALEA
jgi:hypothetical protein